MKAGAELRRTYDTDETTRSIVDMAMPLEGVVRNDSIHAAAVVIGDRPLTEYLPLQQKGADSEVVTQFSMNDVDALGLLKMDFLGLRNLDVIDRAVEIIEQSTGTELDMDAVPLDDRKTYEMMARGDATGVFQFESTGMRDALRQVKPTEFEDIVALVALYRPGPMQFIPDYASNKADASRIAYEDARLAPILETTHGICIYQEQYMEIAEVAGRLQPGRSGRSQEGDRQEDRKPHGVAQGQVHRRVRGQRRPRGDRARALGQGRAGRRLQLQQGPRRLLRPDRLSHGVPARQLSGRVHGRADLVGHVDQGPGAVLRRRVRRHGRRGPAARRQLEPVRLRGGRRAHPLRPGGRQAGRRGRGAGDHRRPQRAAVRLDLGLLRAGRHGRPQPGHGREPDRLRRARLDRGDPAGHVRRPRAGDLGRPADAVRRARRPGLDLRPRRRERRTAPRRRAAAARRCRPRSGRATSSCGARRRRSGCTSRAIRSPRSATSSSARPTRRFARSRTCATGRS